MNHKDFMKQCHDLRVWLKRNPGLTKQEIADGYGSVLGLASMVRLGYVFKTNGKDRKAPTYFAGEPYSLEHVERYQRSFEDGLPHPDECLADEECGPNLRDCLR